MGGDESRVERDGGGEGEEGDKDDEKRVHMFKLNAVLKIKIRPSFCLGRIGLIKIIFVIFAHYFST